MIYYVEQGYSTTNCTLLKFRENYFQVRTFDDHELLYENSHLSPTFFFAASSHRLLSRDIYDNRANAV